MPYFVSFFFCSCECVELFVSESSSLWCNWVFMSDRKTNAHVKHTTRAPQLLISDLAPTFGHIKFVFVVLVLYYFLPLRNMIDLLVKYSIFFCHRCLCGMLALTQFRYLLSIISMNIFARQKRTKNKRRYSGPQLFLLSKLLIYIIPHRSTVKRRQATMTSSLWERNGMKTKQKLVLLILTHPLGYGIVWWLVVSLNWFFSLSPNTA